MVSGGRIGGRSVAIRAMVMAFVTITFFMECTRTMVEASGHRGGKKKEVWRNDIKYIRCDVCEEISKHLTRQVKTRRENLRSQKKLSEYEIIEMVEKICDVDRSEGEWITKLDMVEEGDRIKLVEQDEPGVCNSECRTIQKACEEVLGDHDTDVAELLHKEKTGRSAVSKLLCQKLSGACSGKIPSVPTTRPAGETFVPKSKSQVDAESMMRTMKDAGMPGMKMYSREDLEKGNLEDLGMGADEDDDDDEEEDIRSKVRRAISKEQMDEIKRKKTEEISEKLKEISKNKLKNVVDYGKQASNRLAKAADQAMNWVKDKVKGTAEEKAAVNGKTEVPVADEL